MAFVSYFNLCIMLAFGLLWLGLAVYLRLRKRKGYTYLLCFSVFYIYLYKVLDYTLLQYQSLLLLKRFLPGLMLSGIAAGKSLNLIPLVTLTAADLKTSLLNILLFVPFGIGLPVISHWRLKKVVLAAALFSILIEVLQLLSGRLAGMTFRVADINDIIFNTVGALFGYLLFDIYRTNKKSLAV